MKQYFNLRIQNYAHCLFFVSHETVYVFDCVWNSDSYKYSGYLWLHMCELAIRIAAWIQFYYVFCVCIGSTSSYTCPRTNSFFFHLICLVLWLIFFFKYCVAFSFIWTSPLILWCEWFALEIQQFTKITCKPFRYIFGCFCLITINKFYKWFVFFSLLYPLARLIIS